LPGKWRHIDRHNWGPLAPFERIQGDLTNRRQFDCASPVEHQQQTTANHVAQGAVGLLPLPCLAQFRRQPAPAQTGMLRDEIANKNNILSGNNSAPIAPRLWHLLPSMANR
jgi:hypothetical protein